MKYSVAVILVIAAVASAEPPAPSGGYLARQQAPYPARGIKPAFNLPQRQVASPSGAYGPPLAEKFRTTETPSTTTETIETTTTTVEAELENNKQQQTPGALYVVVPQTQTQVYTSGKLVQQPRLVPVQAVPAFARIQEVPQQIPLTFSAYTSIVNTPYSSSFIQSFQ